MNNTITFGMSLVLGSSIAAKYFNVFKTAQDKVVMFGKSVDLANAKIDNINAIKKHTNSLKKLKEEKLKAGGASSKVAFGILREAEALAKAKKQARDFKIDLSKLDKTQERLGETIAKTQTKILKFNKRIADRQSGLDKIKNIQGRILGAAGVGKIFSSVVGKGLEEEDKSLFLRTVINAKDGNKDRAIGNSIKAARESARNSMATSGELLDIEYNLNSAGLDEDLARASTMMISKVAKVTRGEGEQVAAIMGITFNNMADSIEGTAEKKMSTIGNVLAKTQFKYQIKDFNQLGEGMKEAAASASAAKLPFLQTATIIGQLNNAGVQGSSAGTALNATLRSLTKASEELGFGVVRASDGSLDLIATLANLDDSTNFMQTDEKSDLLQSIFGDEGKKGVIPLLNNIDNLKKGMTELKEAGEQGLVDKEYKTFQSSAGAQLQMLKNNFAQIGTVIGSAVLPAVNLALNGFNWVAKNIAFVSEKMPFLGSALSGLAAGFAGFAIVLLGVAAGQFLYNAAMLLNPITWIVGGIVAAILALVATWQKVKSFFGFGDDDEEKEKEKNQQKPEIGGTIKQGLNNSSGADISNLTAQANGLKNSNTTNNNQITITQAKGEDSEALANRVIEKINYQQGLNQRNALYDIN